MKGRVKSYIKSIDEYKIEIKQKNIEYLEMKSSENSNDRYQKSVYFYLNHPPHVFKKITSEKSLVLGEIYPLKNERILKDYTYNNHYHSMGNAINIDESTEKSTEAYSIDKLIISSHERIKENSYEEKKEIINFEIEDISEYNSFVRIDSFFSQPVEYKNFYLLNLVLRIELKFISNLEIKSFIDAVGQTHNVNRESKISLITDTETEKSINDFLSLKTHKFYKIFLNLHFSLQYSVLCLITTKRINIFSFDIKLLEKFQKMSCEEQEKAAILLEKIYKDQSVDSKTDLCNVFTLYFGSSSLNLDLMSLEEKEKQNIDIMKTRTIEVTPSMIYFKQPMLEKQNHILRKYAEFKDHFIKVNFVDEEGNKIFFSSSTMWVLINFLKNIMLKGVAVGSRHFDFLSASNSQMKNSSYWFFSLEGSRFREIEQMIKELGDFTKETNIHKNAARRGQCLSTTTHIKTMRPSHIKKLPDITRNGYTFTDGIGQISQGLANECCIPFKMDCASAFQIRLGGIKGIVAVNPNLKKELVLFRPSMLKFDSNDTELGVIRCSSFSQGYLNRQIIILLTTLGVERETFLKMLSADLEKFFEFLRDPNSFLLQKNSSRSSLNEDVIKRGHSFIPTLKKFAQNDIDIKYDPFLSSLIYSMVISKVIDLKSKGKILDRYSAVLIGVIDETLTLEEGEVFVKINKNSNYPTNDSNLDYFGNPFNENDTFFILRDNLIVTKNPCLHPGDIKILKANPEAEAKLSHLVNVIVFSAKGDRPKQNEISGGDLDGDSYFVSWNPILLGNKIKYKEVKPMDEMKGFFPHISTKPKEIKMKDIVHSYIEFMKNDTIALISNTHSSIADNDLAYGAFNEKCLKLAELFSIAIDAPKHGNFVRMEDFQKNDLLIKTFPDFLEVGSFCYESPGVLGQLYRLINENEFIQQFEMNEYTYNYLEDYLIDTRFISAGCHKYVNEAYQIYVNYSNEVKNCMKNYRYMTETEFFISENFYDKKQNKKIRQNDNCIEVNSLRDKYKSIILSSFKKNINRDIASAIYLVTYLNDLSYITYIQQFKNNSYYNQLIDRMIQDKRINPNRNIQEDIQNKKKNYNAYLTYIQNKKDYKGYETMIKKKRIFSLPWLIREVRDNLFIDFNYN
jgi:RNA-dependent RNA polymerase